MTPDPLAEIEPEAELKANVFATTFFLRDWMARAEGIQNAYSASERARGRSRYQARLDWDFSAFQEKGERSTKAAIACMVYEFARESEIIRQTVASCRRSLADFAAAENDPNIGMLKSMTLLATESESRWALNRITGANATFFAYVPGFPETPWQAISPDVVSTEVLAATIQTPKMINDLNPAVASEFKVDFNALAMMAENQGMIPLVISINPCAQNWKAITDAVLVALRELHPSLPLTPPPRRDAFEALTALGMLRLRHRYPRHEAIGKCGRDIEDAEWNRYRRIVCEQLRKLFNLPSDELPLSYAFK